MAAVPAAWVCVGEPVAMTVRVDSPMTAAEKNVLEELTSKAASAAPAERAPKPARPAALDTSVLDELTGGTGPKP